MPDTVLLVWNTSVNKMKIILALKDLIFQLCVCRLGGATDIIDEVYDIDNMSC